MKKIILLINLLWLLNADVMFGQTTYCDSIAVDTVFVDNNMLTITVYNSSQHFIVYPYFTLHLNSNSYIQLNDSVQVLSFLSAPGDANNGFSTGSYLGNIAPENTVPLNTNFTGILTITDPNDSSFSCSYPFSFLYGTMPTSLIENNTNNFAIYPNPAFEELTVQASKTIEKTPYHIVDAFGNIVSKGFITADQNQIDISQIAAGIYSMQIISEKPYTNKIVILKH